MAARAARVGLGGLLQLLLACQLATVHGGIIFKKSVGGWLALRWAQGLELGLCVLKGSRRVVQTTDLYCRVRASVRVYEQGGGTT